MNPKILELAQQAGMYVDLNGSPWPKWMGAEECEVAYARFAELIVKKCAYLVNHQQRTTGYTAHAKMLCEEFEIEFKEEDFFGVEE